jgi:hypothetical protein
MTTSIGLREVTDADLDQALELVLAPRLAERLSARGPGHCMRVNDFSGALSVMLTRSLRNALGGTVQVHVLGSPPQIPAEVAVTGTKLVELRNPAQDGALRPALLVFVPPASQASAEDSFGVATFEEVTIGDCYADLSRHLLAGIPQELRSALIELFGVLEDEVGPDGITGDGGVSQARFLLTVALNDNDPEAAGAALFELGLVPDFELFSNRTLVRTRVAQNFRQIQILGRPDGSVRQRVVDLRLRDQAFRAKLADLVFQTGLDDARSWTRRIVADPANWPLSFHRWPLPDAQPVQSVDLVMGDLALPRAEDSADHHRHPVLGSITGQPYLIIGSSGPAQLVAEFDVQPDPRQVPGLAKFVVQLISEDSGPTGVRATVAVSSTIRRAYRATLRKLRSAHLDPGWHYLRVLPLGRDNTPLPVAPSVGVTNRAANESERFFAVTAEELDEPPVAPRTRRNTGVTQEMRQLELAAVAEGRDWRGIECATVTWRADGGCALEAAFGTHGLVEIPLSPVLVEIERAILAEPERLTPRRLRSASGLPARPAEAVAADETDRTPDTELYATFRHSRRQVLGAIRGQDRMIVAGRDILAFRQQILTYAEAYAEVLSHQLQQAERSGDRPGALRDLATLLQIDTVIIEYRGAHDELAEITLVAPTHPLRLLWLLTWATLGRAWTGDAVGRDHSMVLPLKESLSGLQPSGFPLVVPREDGRLSMAAGDFGPYWQVCLPTETQDPHALLAEVSTSLELPDRAQDGRDLSPSRLADCVERYVRMHPYVRTLVTCAVNAGYGERLADMLLELERRTTTCHLCHDVRLFAADPQTPGTGEALADLLNGRWSGVAEAEAFQTPTAGTPKLAVAVRPMAEFRSATSQHTAHVTFLFDAFSGESLGVGPESRRVPAPVHGLVQGMVIEYVDDEDVVSWHRQPRHGWACDLTGAEELSDLLATLPEIISRATAAVSTAETGTGQLPRATLSLTAADQALLHQAHRSSDWVVTVDRMLGVEYFDNPGSMRRPEYIIDFATTGCLGSGHQIVISSRSVDELQALLVPMIEQHGFEIDRRHTGTFFDQLRLLSGRLAFKIASTAPNQRTEVLGLALARLYLAYQRALDDQVLVPLDSHLELYREARRHVDEVAEAAGLQRTDLALFSLDARRRTIVCRLVEVKCYRGLSGVADLQRVRERMAVQLNRSAEVLAENFDSELHSPDRPDRLVRNAQLAGLLRFYLGRAVRHGVMRPDAAAEADWLLDHLDQGYQWDFTRTGLIFDLSGQGTEREVDGGIEFHTVGRDVVEDLLGALATDPVLAGGYDATSVSAASPTGTHLSVPRLDNAGFRGPRRSHEIPPDEPRFIGRTDEASAEPSTGLSSAPLAEPWADYLPNPAPPASREGPESPSTALQVRAGRGGKAPTAELPVHPADAVRNRTETPSAALAQSSDVYLGSAGPSPQFGVLGEAFGKRLALDLNETHTISLFGVQGGGKSYTLGSVIEAASLPAPPVNQLPRPLATIVFHYSATPDYAPEFTSMVTPNDDADQVHLLRERYGIEPSALTDVVMLVPENQVAQRQAEYHDIQVRALAFGSAELQARHWRFLMGAVGNQSTYVRQLNRIMRTVRSQLTLQAIRDGIDNSSLTDSIKQLAHQRLDLAGDYIDDAVRVGDLVQPGRMIIVDLRDDLMEKDEALGLFVVLMELFAAATGGDQRFNKLVVFDEAHKYIESPDLVASLIESVREMRHKGMSVLVASQDPPSVPLALIELSDLVILHRFNSPGWLKHLQKANTALADLTSAKMNALAPGEAYIWAGKATDPAFTRGAVKISLRPRITRHGGGTRTAMERD